MFEGKRKWITKFGFVIFLTNKKMLTEQVRGAPDQ